MPKLSDFYKVGGGLLFGAVIGGVAGMLLAPKSGKETREEIKAKANEAQEKTQELIEQTKERAELVYEKGRDMVAEKRDWAMETINSGKEALISGKEALMNLGEPKTSEPVAVVKPSKKKAKAAKPRASAS